MIPSLIRVIFEFYLFLLSVLFLILCDYVVYIMFFMTNDTCGSTQFYSKKTFL